MGVYNGERYLDDAVSSVLRTRGLHELLVCDDGSTDSTPELLEKWATDPRVTTWRRNGPDGTPTPAFNECLDRATGTHIFPMSADNRLVPWSFEMLLSLDVDCAYGDLQIFDENSDFVENWTYGAWPHTAPELFEWGRETLRCPLPSEGMLWRTDWLREHDCRFMRFDDTVRDNDVLTLLDWLSKGPSVAYVPTAVLLFRSHSDSLSNRHATHDEIARGQAGLKAWLTEYDERGRK
jgi:glycosyltransferase involved in cell wall biosynthesis